MEQEYAAWVAATDACSACGKVNGNTAQQYIINERIRASPHRPPLPLPVVPQAGYLGPKYEEQEHRYLVLGLNPAGGWDGHAFYAWQDLLTASTAISDTVLAEPLFECARAQLMALITGPEWKHLQAMQLFSVLDGRKIAYANQVLCRTTVLAGDIPTKASRDIRLTCWKERVKELIRILLPDTIVAIGSDWGNEFIDLVIQEQWGKQIKVIVLPFPSRGKQYVANAILGNYARKVEEESLSNPQVD